MRKFSDLARFNRQEYEISFTNEIIIVQFFGIFISGTGVFHQNRYNDKQPVLLMTYLFRLIRLHLFIQIGDFYPRDLGLFGIALFILWNEI